MQQRRLFPGSILLPPDNGVDARETLYSIGLNAKTTTTFAMRANAQCHYEIVTLSPESGQTSS